MCVCTDPSGVSHVYVHETSRNGRRCLIDFLEVNGLESRVTLIPEDLTKLSPEDIKYNVSYTFHEPLTKILE